MASDFPSTSSGFVADGEMTGTSWRRRHRSEGEASACAGWRSIGGQWVPIFVVFARVDDAGSGAGYFELGVLVLDGDVIFGRFVQQREDVALEGADADGRVPAVGEPVATAVNTGLSPPSSGAVTTSETAGATPDGFCWQPNSKNNKETTAAKPITRDMPP